jgi:hypothetical protein
MDVPEYNSDNLAVDGCTCGCNDTDPTGLRNLGTALMVARLSAYRVTVPGVMDIIAALNDLIAGVEEMQRQ